MFQVLGIYKRSLECGRGGEGTVKDHNLHSLICAVIQARMELRCAPGLIHKATQVSEAVGGLSVEEGDVKGAWWSGRAFWKRRDLIQALRDG